MKIVIILFLVILRVYIEQVLVGTVRVAPGNDFVNKTANSEQRVYNMLEFPRTSNSGFVLLYIILIKTIAIIQKRQILGFASSDSIFWEVVWLIEQALALTRDAWFY
jgi:hypothetical protein